MASVDDRIREWLDGLDEPYAPPVEAAKFVASEWENHSEEFTAWLVEHAPVFVTQRMGEANRSDRAVALGRRKSRVFGEASDAAGQGDDGPLRSIFDTPYSAEGMTYKLGQMVHSAVQTVADDYEQRSVANAFEATFLRSLAKRLPKNDSKTVADVFGEEQIAGLRRSLAA